MERSRGIRYFLPYDSIRKTRIALGKVMATDDGVPKRVAKESRPLFALCSPCT
jgi:hypothetical protein